jgi:hydroxyacylglutathione hydrolase
MIKVSYIPAFDDNYIWLIHKENNPHIVIVDPGDAGPVLDAIAASSYIPVAILVTHHHGDHVGGIRRLTRDYPVPVYGPANEGISSITHPVREGDHVEIEPLGCSFAVLEVPGHTRGHIAYYSDKLLFCGDTLFTAGCGRLFEGTPQQMYQSLQKIASLPDDTLVYCAHEYTLDNLKFAMVVEPDSPALQQRLQDTLVARKQGQATVPAPLSLEKATNPFLRCHLPNVIKAAESFALKRLQSGADTFTVVRHWKDTLD